MSQCFGTHRYVVPAKAGREGWGLGVVERVGSAGRKHERSRPRGAFCRQVPFDGPDRIAPHRTSEVEFQADKRIAVRTPENPV